MEGPLVILFITRFIRGGAQIAVFLLAENLPYFGYNVLLVTGQESGEEGSLLYEAKKRGINIRIIPSLRRDVSILRDICSLFEIIKVLKETKPAILHTFTSKAGFIGRMAGTICRVPVTIYSPRGHIFNGYFSPWKRRCFWLLEKLALRMCDAFVCLTEEERREWQKYGFCHPYMPIIHSGVEIEKFEKPSVPPDILKKELGIEEGSKTVGYIGRLAPVKGARYLLLAGEILLKKYKNLNILFVGDGEERAILERMLREKGLDKRIHFLGHKEDVVDYLHIMDIVVVPSINEGFGRVIVEAWAGGKAVVGSAVGGIKELIEDYQTGLLVSPASPLELAEAIEKLLSNDELRSKLGERGKEKAKKYSVEEMVKKTVELYEFLLRCKGLHREGGRNLSSRK